MEQNHFVINPPYNFSLSLSPSLVFVMLWLHCSFLEIIVRNRLVWWFCKNWACDIHRCGFLLVCLLPRDRLVHTNQAIKVFPSAGPAWRSKEMTIKMNPTVHKWRYLINIYRNDYKYCTNLLLENILKNKWNVDDNLSFSLLLLLIYTSKLTGVSVPAWLISELSGTLRTVLWQLADPKHFSFRFRFSHSVDKRNQIPFLR